LFFFFFCVHCCGRTSVRRICCRSGIGSLCRGCLGTIDAMGELPVGRSAEAKLTDGIVPAEIGAAGEGRFAGGAVVCAVDGVAGEGVDDRVAVRVHGHSDEAAGGGGKIGGGRGVSGSRRQATLRMRGFGTTGPRGAAKETVGPSGEQGQQARIIMRGVPVCPEMRGGARGGRGQPGEAIRLLKY
jgi:hypothetical protein